MINYKATGRKLSKQTWAILPKIREVDELLRSDSKARDKLAEVHPELLFWSLSSQQAMQHNKKMRQGLCDRFHVLERWYTSVRDLHDDALARYRRKDVAGDDVVDAMAAAVTGLVSNGSLREIPTYHPVDSQGLPMRMVIPDIH